jgi:hypothetical protein
MVGLILVMLVSVRRFLFEFLVAAISVGARILVTHQSV